MALVDGMVDLHTGDILLLTMISPRLCNFLKTSIPQFLVHLSSGLALGKYHRSRLILVYLFGSIGKCFPWVSLFKLSTEFLAEIISQSIVIHTIRISRFFICVQGAKNTKCLLLLLVCVLGFFENRMHGCVTCLVGMVCPCNIFVILGDKMECRSNCFIT